MTDEEKKKALVEKVARQLCSFDNKKWDDLCSATHTLFDGCLSQETYLRRAKSILFGNNLTLIDKSRGVTQKAHVWEYPIIPLEVE